MKCSFYIIRLIKACSDFFFYRPVSFRCWQMSIQIVLAPWPHFCLAYSYWTVYFHSLVAELLLLLPRFLPCSLSLFLSFARQLLSTGASRPQSTVSCPQATGPSSSILIFSALYAGRVVDRRAENASPVVDNQPTREIVHAITWAETAAYNLRHRSFTVARICRYLLLPLFVTALLYFGYIKSVGKWDTLRWSGPRVPMSQSPHTLALLSSCALCTYVHYVSICVHVVFFYV